MFLHQPQSSTWEQILLLVYLIKGKNINKNTSVNVTELMDKGRLFICSPERQD